MPELVVIMVVALLVLGPKRLPEVAKGLGKALAELRRATSGITEELENARVMLEQEAREADRKLREAERNTLARGSAAPASPPATPAESPLPSPGDPGSEPPRA